MSEQEDLVERITREVMARLQALPGGTAGAVSPATSPPAAPPPASAPPAGTAGSVPPAVQAYQRSYWPQADPTAPGVPAASSAFQHPSAADEEDRARSTNPSQRSPDAVRSLVAAGASRIGGEPGSRAVPKDIARYIDHTLLKPHATEEQIVQLCREALEYHFASVCVNPAFVRLCANQLRGSDVKVCAVVGFPLGATTPSVKAFEARKAIREGAREIDMVINVGALKSGDYDLVLRDIEAVVEACHDAGAITKVIIEAALLTDEQKVAACVLAKRAKADFVKTSTGFASGGATIRDVAIMRATVGPEMGVKAAGGIRTYLDALGMIEAGATRIGASAGVQIVKESRGESAPAAGGKGNY